MNPEQEPVVPEVSFIRELVEEGLELDGDIVQLGVSTWAVHGRAVYGGEMILAEFEALDTARIALQRLSRHDPPADDPPVRSGGG